MHALRTLEEIRFPCIHSVVAAVVALSAAGNAGADWTKVSNSGTGADDFTGYVDAATIKCCRDVANMANLRDYLQSKVLKASGKTYLSSRVSVEYCKQEKMRWIEPARFAAAICKREVVYLDGKTRQWISVLGGTVAEKRWKIACGQQKPPTAVANV